MVWLEYFVKSRDLYVQLMPDLLKLQKMPDLDHTLIPSKISLLKAVSNEHGGVVEMAENDWLKIQELQQKKIFDREEMEYITKYAPLIIVLDD